MELDPATIATMRAIKQALDPDNIMNPGKIFGNEAAAQ
jgi:FAD/FMN-containing dehydrogenase